MEHFVITLMDFLKDLSYAGVILALTFEFIPGELVLPLVGYWVSQGDMNFYLAILAGAIGGTTGPLTLYALGRFGGRPMIEKYGKYFFIRQKEIDLADSFFAKYGSSVAFFGRFLPLVRTAISLPCGIAKMNVWKFSLYTFLGVLPITVLYTYLGFKLGSNWGNVKNLAGEYTTPLALVVLLLIAVFASVKYLKKAKSKV